MNEPNTVTLTEVPPPTDVARLVVTPVHDGYECTLFRAEEHHDVIAAWHHGWYTDAEDWLEEADMRLDRARIVMTGHRPDGHNRWTIQGGTFLEVAA